MVDWQVTATTIYCDAVDDNVTIIVNQDWTTRCTGYRKYVDQLDEHTAKGLRQRSKNLNRQLKCEGPLDHRVISYRDALRRRL